MLNFSAPRIDFGHFPLLIKACYLADKEVIEYLNRINYEDDFYNKFRLNRIEGAGLIYDNVIQVQVQNPNSLEWMLFGKLCYTEKRQDNEGNIYIWFEIENEVFYTPLYKNMNILVFLNTITDELELVNNNITTLDIAMDSNINFAKRIKKAIFNKNLIPIVNRKSYDDEREKIDGVRFNYGCNRLRLLDVAIYNSPYDIIWRYKRFTVLCYGELSREISGITTKMLTQTLREFESDDLIHRKMYPEVPPKVEYALTDTGKELFLFIKYLVE